MAQVFYQRRYLWLLDHIAEYSGFYAFAASYLCLTVFGLLLFALGDNSAVSFTVDEARLAVAREPLFWVLVLSPFVVLPLIIVLTRRVVSPVAPAIMRALPELSLAMFFAMSAVCWGYIIYAFRAGNVVELFMSAQDWRSSIEMRFKIASELGILPFIVLFSILTFLTVYATTNAIREKSLTWIALATFHVLFLFVSLVLLNRKWPAVLLILMLSATFFLNAPKYRVLLAATLAVLGAATYLIISVIVFRAVPTIAPSSPPAPVSGVSASPANKSSIVHIKPSVHPNKSSKPSEKASNRVIPYQEKTYVDISMYLNKAVVKATKMTPMLLEKLVKRMAVPALFYYDIFTARGPFCGSMIEGYLKTPGSCHPSYVVYNSMFPSNLADKGTAPIAFHIYEYARDSWAGTAISLVVGAIILSLFSALWPFVQERPLAGAMMVMGVYAGYFLSQLPLEGAVLYYHGAVWWFVFVVLLNTAAVAFFRSIRKFAPLDPSQQGNA